MPSDHWEDDGKLNGWQMPRAPRWKRLPVIRHIRAIYHNWRVSQHEWFYSRIGMLTSGYDRWVLHGIWRGKERDYD